MIAPVFSIGDASGILRDSILSRRLHRDLSRRQFSGPLQILPREMSSRHPGGLDVFDESIRGHFRYANSLSAGKRYAWCAHSAPWTISPETSPLQAWFRSLLSPSPPPSSLDPSPELRLHSCEPFVQQSQVAERGSSGNEVDSGLLWYSLGA